MCVKTDKNFEDVTGPDAPQNVHQFHVYTNIDDKIWNIERGCLSQ